MIMKTPRTQFYKVLNQNIKIRPDDDGDNDKSPVSVTNQKAKKMYGCVTGLFYAETK